MANTSDFLPFAVGSGANVLSQGDYAALTAVLANGFQAGTAISAQLNKVWRQSSIMSAVIGQFIANNSGQNAVDDGTIATLLANFGKALSSYISRQPALNDTGAENAYAVAFNPALTSPVAWAPFWFTVKTANTGPSTLNATGAAYTLVGAGHTPLQGGELVANGEALVYWNPMLNSGGGQWVLVSCTGASTQVVPATQPQHAAQLSQVVGIVGESRNAKMLIASASASATYTADELIVETALGGLRYCLANVSDTFNLTTDMDTGTAPVSGFVALYKLYNPTTKASIRRIVNATSAIAPEIYAGAAAPAGFTASALLAVLPTAGGQFAPCSLVDRTVTIVPATAFSTINTGISYASFSVAGQVPINAKKALIGAGSTNSTQGASLVLYVASTVFGLGAIQGVNTYAGPNVGPIEFGELPLLTPQTLFWKSTNSAGSPTFNVYVNNYTF